MAVSVEPLPGRITVDEFSADIDAAVLGASIAAENFPDRRATVIDSGRMGKPHVSVLQALPVESIHVCSQRGKMFHGLRTEGIDTIEGEFEALIGPWTDDELAVVALSVSEHLAEWGYSHVPIEKPISLFLTRLRILDQVLTRRSVRARCAYNRTAYLSPQEVRSRAASYRLCTLEGVFRRDSNTGDREKIEVATFASAVKPGFVEQVSASFPGSNVRASLPSLEDAASLTEFGEQILGY